jgi:DNA mismatch endonuclease (patch repair protein)
LHRLGYRFRKDLRVRTGDHWTRPDIVFTRLRLAIFVDGCFWHGCPSHGRLPRVNESYWAPKLASNTERDRRNTAALQRDGWIVVRLWEHVSLTNMVSEVTGAIRTAAQRDH